MGSPSSGYFGPRGDMVTIDEAREWIAKNGRYGTRDVVHAITGYHPQYVTRLATLGRLPVLRQGNRYLYDIQEIVDHIEDYAHRNFRREPKDES